MCLVMIMEWPLSNPVGLSLCSNNWSTKEPIKLENKKGAATSYRIAAPTNTHRRKGHFQGRNYSGVSGFFPRFERTFPYRHFISLKSTIGPLTGGKNEPQ